VITGAILFIVLGFYLRMLLECGFGREIDHWSCPVSVDSLSS